MRPTTDSRAPSEPWPWELRRPELLLRHLDREGWLRTWQTLLARVRDPAGAQELLGCDQVWAQEPDEREDARDLVEASLRRLGLPEWDWPDYNDRDLIVPVVVRHGPLLPFQWDFDVLYGLRYANSFQVRRGDLLLVTPHGWCSALEEFGAREPRATLATPPAVIMQS